MLPFGNLLLQNKNQWLDLMVSVHESYQNLGVDQFYSDHPYDYVNHHTKPIINHLNSLQDLFSDSNSILDLCCGDGLVTKHLSNQYKHLTFMGIDPYLNQRYENEAGFPCLDWDFLKLSKEIIPKQFDVIVCSFALHLCPNTMLSQVLFNLSQVSNNLIIISPHKKPSIDQFWTLYEHSTFDRVHMKHYFPFS